MDYLIGHLIGDYLLQNDWQATNKKAHNLRGWSACTVHCVLYTLAVILCTGWYRWDLVGLVFLSHFPIDKTYVVAKFMRIVGSFHRVIDWEECSGTWLLDTTVHACLAHLVSDIEMANNTHKVWAYLLIDNTVHLTLLWLISKYVV